jgi:hypothetical protein
MNTKRNTLGAGITALLSGGLLMVAVPTGTGEAAPPWKPPMPCVAIRAGVMPGAAGFCPGTNNHLDWATIERSLSEAGGGGSVSVNSARLTPTPS